MRLRTISVAVALMTASACGTGDADLTFDEPTPTLFADDDQIVTDTTTTRAPTVGVEQLVDATLPSPRSGVNGVVVVDGIALAVDESIGTDAWVVTSPCGTPFAGDGIAIETPLVVLDPAGDARVEVHGAVVPELNHAVTSVLASELEAAGVATVTTRDGDDDVAAAVRSRAASASGAVVVVSVAITEGDGELAERAPLEVVHPAADADSRRLAALVHQQLTPVLADLPGAWTDDVEPGVRAVLNQRGTDFFTLLREADDHARVVVHLPTLTADTVDLLASPVTAVNVAQALADAIARFLLTDEQGSGFVEPAEVVRNAATANGDECVEPLAVVEPGADDEVG